MLIIYTRNTTFEHRNTTFGHSEGNTPLAVFVTVSHAFLCKMSCVTKYENMFTKLRCYTYADCLSTLIPSNRGVMTGWSRIGPIVCFTPHTVPSTLSGVQTQADLLIPRIEVPIVKCEKTLISIIFIYFGVNTKIKLYEEVDIPWSS